MPKITMKEVKSGEYRCAMCKEIFSFGWTDEEAREEATSKDINPEESDIVCDDCYNQTPWGNN